MCPPSYIALNIIYIHDRVFFLFGPHENLSDPSPCRNLNQSNIDRLSIITETE